MGKRSWYCVSVTIKTMTMVRAEGATEAKERVENMGTYALVRGNPAEITVDRINFYKEVDDADCVEGQEEGMDINRG